MPSLSVGRDILSEALGLDCAAEQFERSVFDFGIELDDVYEEDGRTMYKFDIPANRYDLLCTEGLAAALRTYMHSIPYSDIAVAAPSATVYKFPTHERECVACAVIKGISFTDESYDSFISYQDKLHLSIGRNRSIVSIGTHDYDKMDGPVVYRSAALSDIGFVPLNYSKAHAGTGLCGSKLQEYYAGDKNISKYFALLSDSEHSVVFQSGRTVISVPPIINSDNTKISKETRNVFVEVTGTDFSKVNTALKLILYNFRGTSIESVAIKEISRDMNDREAEVLLNEATCKENAAGACSGKSKTERCAPLRCDGNINEGWLASLPLERELVTPVFYNRKYEIPIEYIAKKLKISLTGPQIKAYLERMMYNVELSGETITASTIDVRSDILHACDIIEDVAIAHGFNNFPRETPEICTIGREDPLNKFTDKIRIEMALMGLSEVLTLTLLSKNENFVNPDDQVVLSNPKSREYEVVRTSLLPGVLKSIASNLHGRIPIKAFEAADVVLCDGAAAEGAVNRRMLCGCIASNTSLLEELQGPLSLLFEKCGLREYKYEHCNDPRYLENQGASIMVGGEAIGSIGVLHPRVCTAFKIPYAASAFELDLEALFEKFLLGNKN